MSSDVKFEGWAGMDEHACEGKLEFQSFTPKRWDDDDVDVKILYCGICGSDASALSGEWGPVQDICPQICGHEIVGEVVRAGSKVDNGIKVGQIVGIGPQSDSCRECEWCHTGEENLCPNQTMTFNAPYRRGEGKGSISRGGFAKYWRGPSRFAIPVPEGLDPAVAAPMMCGGVTVYSPLARFGAGTTAKKVGVIGVGGLGHFGIMFAKAMGAEVTAISRGDGKRDDAVTMGASKYIATGSDLRENFKGHERSLDLIICTINPPELPVADYIPLLRPRGHIVLVGAVVTPLQVPAFPLIVGASSISGSNIGSPHELKAMMQFAVEHNVKPWVERWDMNDINRAMPAFKEGKPRYRYVLVNTENGGRM